MNYKEYLQRDPTENEPIMPWIKFFYKDYALIADMYKDDEHSFAQLIHGMFHYMATEEILQLDSKDVQNILRMQCREIQNKIAAYRNMCTKNAKNRNGETTEKATAETGTAETMRHKQGEKAEKAKEKAAPKPDFSATALKQLYNYLTDSDNEKADLSEYEFSNFCNDLRASGWKYAGVQITDIRQIETIITTPWIGCTLL